MTIVLGLLLPLLGTTLGSAMVFLLKKNINSKIEKLLLGFASGVMIAASVWSLLLPAIDLSAGGVSWLPASVGFILGVLFLLIVDKTIPINTNAFSNGNKKTMLFFAVTLHNIPEGMAVGVAFAGALLGKSITMSSALALAVGIAVQNFPEGSIISMPLVANGKTKCRAFWYGFLSGVVEPIFAGITILLVNVIAPILPYFLAFAAGAMIYVVVEELIPEAQENGKSSLVILGVTLGFVLMMVLDVALG